jgi:uncharacterized membrane protein
MQKHQPYNEPIISFEAKNKRYELFACHRIPERSIIIKGKPFLCYRCFGLNAGFFLMIIIQTIGFILLAQGTGFLTIHWLELITGKSFILKILMVLIMQLPFVIDGLLQSLTRYTSNNPLRLLTGLIGGIGQFYFVVILGQLTRFLLF